MSDSPDEHETPVACPACDSVNIAVRRARDPKYQCRDCGTEFAENGDLSE
jgi:transposase-like protein